MISSTHDTQPVAVVTGASRGLGRAVALDLAASGYHVVGVARTLEALLDVQAEAADSGWHVQPVAADVLNPSAVGAAFSVAAEFGRLEAVVSCAGANPSFRRAVDVTSDEFDEIVRVNLNGSFNVSTAAIRAFEAQGDGGSLILIGSAGASVPIARNAAYCAAKAGLVHLARVLALECAGTQLRVNAINPGFLATDLTAGLRSTPDRQRSLTDAIPLNRIGETADVLGAVRYLASKDSSYMTGAVLEIDGGYGLRRGWPQARPH